MSHSSSHEHKIDSISHPDNKEVTDNHKQNESSNGMDIIQSTLNKLTQEFRVQMSFINERLSGVEEELNKTLTELNKSKSLCITPNDIVEEKNRSSVWAMDHCTNNFNSQWPSRQIVQLDVSKLTWCDTKTDYGGWILIQRRVVGDANFTRGWDDYKHGFGSTAGDFWLGNDWISWLTRIGYTELRVDLIIGNTRQYAEYSNFKVDNEAAKYRMSLSSFRGNATDGLSYHNGMKFTTIDSDNDENSGNCAQSFNGGWWYNNCHYSNLNGIWNVSGTTGVYWIGDVKSVEIKLRKI
ncbi:ficolin-2-like [Physella acuta]|uniref:ficolin-2-like n=1 Tax=Physella acuta TaxID=109671 RepID=UPI0027DAFF5D|nr:ficolin-2-like [Physella acuta]